MKRLIGVAVILGALILGGCQGPLGHDDKPSQSVSPSYTGPRVSVTYFYDVKMIVCFAKITEHYAREVTTMVNVPCEKGVQAYGIPVNQ